MLLPGTVYDHPGNHFRIECFTGIDPRHNPVGDGFDQISIGVEINDGKNVGIAGVDDEVADLDRFDIHHGG